jgi:hypothetical protein
LDYSHSSKEYIKYSVIMEFYYSILSEGVFMIYCPRCGQSKYVGDCFVGYRSVQVRQSVLFDSNGVFKRIKSDPMQDNRPISISSIQIPKGQDITAEKCGHCGNSQLVHDWKGSRETSEKTRASFALGVYFLSNDEFSRDWVPLAQVNEKIEELQQEILRLQLYEERYQKECSKGLWKRLVSPAKPLKEEEISPPKTLISPPKTLSEEPPNPQ